MTSLEPAGRRRRLVVLRHGLTGHNAKGIWQGHLDVALTDEGVSQAEAVAEVIGTYEPVIVASSDLQRARRTAEAVVAAMPGMELRVDERFREIHVGRWQGMERAVMLERYPDAPARWERGGDYRWGEDGETYAEVGDRAAAGVAAVLADLEDGATALIVTHGITARVITGDLLGLHRDMSWRVLSALGNCHWVELREYGDGWQLTGWNLRPRFGADAPAG